MAADILVLEREALLDAGTAEVAPVGAVFALPGGTGRRPIEPLTTSFWTSFNECESACDARDALLKVSFNQVLGVQSFAPASFPLSESSLRLRLASGLRLLLRKNWNSLE